MSETIKIVKCLLYITLVACSISCAANEPKAENTELAQTGLHESEASEAANTKLGWSDKAQEVLINALSLSGIQYKYGGSSPDTGFDCSGFVRYVFKQAANLTLPRTSYGISQLGKQVRTGDLKPGDLVFFNTLKSAFSHVGIYVGDNKFIHSPSSGGGVRIESMDSQYWQKRFNGAKRLEAQE